MRTYIIQARSKEYGNYGSRSGYLPGYFCWRENLISEIIFHTVSGKATMPFREYYGLMLSQLARLQYQKFKISKEA